jgi:RNA polymerase sigma factor (TIGR02999 family)
MEGTISSLIRAAEQGDASAGKALFSALYSELHRLARRELGRPGISVSLSPTTLLHEAYLDMAAQAGPSFPDRARFMSYAARVMRGLIIDHVRSRHARKRGGHFELTSLENEAIEPAVNDRVLARLGDALDELAGIEPSLAEVVDLKFFCGFSFSEIARIRGVSEKRTIQRHWDKARIYLHRSIRADMPL